MPRCSVFDATEIAKKFDEIVAFAELEAFIDNQVKFYSSGMYVRLGFAVAVNMDPDILLVDEVLAVGDEAFQRKCINKIREFQHEGRTIVFVSHGMDQVRQICDRAFVLDHGKLVTEGPPGEAIRSFREHLLEARRLGRRGQRSNRACSSATARPKWPRPTSWLRSPASTSFTHLSATRSYLLPGEPLQIRVGFKTDGALTT